MEDFITDDLGRSTFHHIAARNNVRPTQREVRWLKHIERHGPQSSEILYELTRETHRCKDTSLRDIQKLRAGGFLTLPRQQRATDRAEFNPYIYDLTRQAHDYLSSLGQSEPTLRPTGHWWHGYTTSAFTGSLDILSRRKGREFIPTHKILDRNNSDLAIPVRSKRVIPDQLFAIRYKNGFRAFLLEVDRGTEPKRSDTARKNLRRSIDEYAEIFARDLARKHYGIKANIVSLWVFSNPVTRSRFHEMVQDRAEAHTAFFLTKLLPERLTWTNLDAVHQSAWLAGDGRDVRGL